MNNFMEVSAVITHPHFTGKGFAKQLVAHAANKILSENKTSYLHAAETNFYAKQLYEKVGYKTRRKINFWNLATNLSVTG